MGRITVSKISAYVHPLAVDNITVKGGKIMSTMKNPYMARGQLSEGPGCTFDASAMNHGASNQIPSN